MTDVLRPGPRLTADNRVFWEAAREGRLVVQECANCGRRHHPPRVMCPNCHCTDQLARDLPGSGVVHSYSLLHHPQHKAFDYPVVAVLVDLDDGPRILSGMPSADPASVHIGMRVRVAFAPTQDGGQVPVFEAEVAA